MSTVYLLHFDEPYPAGKRPQHYLGVCRDISERMREHLSGSSKSRLTRACTAQGIFLHLAQTWSFASADEAFQHEKEVKARKKSYAYICPLCKEKRSNAS